MASLDFPLVKPPIEALQKVRPYGPVFPLYFPHVMNVFNEPTGIPRHPSPVTRMCSPGSGREKRPKERC